MKEKERILFDENIEIPDIVSKKAETAFLQIRQSQERENDMEKNMEHEMTREQQSTKSGHTGVKTAVAAAAAFAVLVAVSGAVGGVSGQHAHTDGASDIDMADASPAVNGASDIDMADASPATDIAAADTETIEKVFALALKEAKDGQTRELETGKPVAIKPEWASSWVICGDEESSHYSYCLGLPVVCEGEDIDSVTYSVNQGAFEIVEAKSASIVTDMKKYDGIINAGSIGGGTDEATGEEMDTTTAYCTEFTLDYDRQFSETTWINMVRDHIFLTDDDADAVFGDGKNVEKRCAAMQKLIDGLSVTCTVHFTDGTEQTAQLEVNAVMGTAKELGIENAVDPDAKDVFFIFERK